MGLPIERLMQIKDDLQEIRQSLEAAGTAFHD